MRYFLQYDTVGDKQSWRRVSGLFGRLDMQMQMQCMDGKHASHLQYKTGYADLFDGRDGYAGRI